MKNMNIAELRAPLEPVPELLPDSELREIAQCPPSSHTRARLFIDPDASPDSPRLIMRVRPGPQARIQSEFDGYEEGYQVRVRKGDEVDALTHPHAYAFHAPTPRIPLHGVAEVIEVAA